MAKVYIYFKNKENPSLINYLESLNDTENFNVEKNYYTFEIKEMYIEEYTNILNNIEFDFFEKLPSFINTSKFEGKILSEILGLLKNRRSGVNTLSDILKESILKNNEDVKHLFKEYFSSKLNPEIIETGLTFVECENVIEASKKLYIHRNTLLYRLDQIEKKTSLNLKNFIDKLVFYGIMS